jgi:hypothetical protein
MRIRNIPAPIVTTLLLVLAVVAVTGWGWRWTGTPGTPAVAHLGRTKAKMFDGACVFAADVELRGTLSGMTFSRNYLEIKEALVDLLRTKSEYMVRSAVARESLRSQMVDVVNRVAGRTIAGGVTFSEFLLL